MGAQAHDDDLCMREFSKTLTDRAYTEYADLKPGLAHNWEQLYRRLTLSFFYAKPNITLAELRRTHQYLGEDLDAYVKRFHKKALESCGLELEEVLVDLCLHGMTKEYKIFLENLSCSSFSRLMEAAR